MIKRKELKDGDKVLIGYASVDSGQLMVVDPCYVDKGHITMVLVRQL